SGSKTPTRSRSSCRWRPTRSPTANESPTASACATRKGSSWSSSRSTSRGATARSAGCAPSAPATVRSRRRRPVARGAAADEEATGAWSGPLFERFVRFRPYVAEGLGAHGEVAMAVHPPRPGDRVLDIGCGVGDTTRRLAGLVGEAGDAVGIDVAPPFVDLAREEAAAAGVANVDFRLGDV